VKIKQLIKITINNSFSQYYSVILYDNHYYIYYGHTDYTHHMRTLYLHDIVNFIDLEIRFVFVAELNAEKFLTTNE